MSFQNECARNLNWAGGNHTFNLNAPQVIRMMSGEPCSANFEAYRDRVLPMHGPALAGQFGATPSACLKRFEEGVYSIEDIERVILLGLIGGGAPPATALDLVKCHVRGKPLAKNAVVAYEILGALFIGAKVPAPEAGA